MRMLPILTLFALTACGADGVAGSLCEGDNCVNSADCPTAEPVDGDECDFQGNCHYCGDGTDADGYTCDGSTFTSQGVFDCSTSEG